MNFFTPTIGNGDDSSSNKCQKNSYMSSQFPYSGSKMASNTIPKQNKQFKIQTKNYQPKIDENKTKEFNKNVSSTMLPNKEKYHKHLKIYHLNRTNLNNLNENEKEIKIISKISFLQYFNNIFNLNINIKNINFLLYFYIIIFLFGNQLLNNVSCQNIENNFTNAVKFIDNTNNINNEEKNKNQDHLPLQLNNNTNDVDNINKKYKNETNTNKYNVNINKNNENNNFELAEVKIINFGYLNITNDIKKDEQSSLPPSPSMPPPLLESHSLKQKEGDIDNDHGLNDIQDDIEKNNSNENMNDIDNNNVIDKFLVKDYHDGFPLSHDLNDKLTPIYLNEFAVYVPAGLDAADRIANKYGFSNMGQIGSLKNYYLFHHRHVSKRSTLQSSLHHSALNSEPEVRWMQQQHEKIRKKRDYSQDIKFPGFSSLGLSALTGGGSGSDTGTGIGGSSLLYRNAAPVSPLTSPSGLGYGSGRPTGTGIGFTGYNSNSGASSSLLRRIAPQSRLQYRATSPHNIFPDPLFKEQWYLNGGAKDGLDMNVEPAWQKGYTGKGVVVSILDDGIQTNHPDLAQNYDPLASYDINGNDSDPMPQDNGDNKHGTRCAGEVAAVAFNNYCGVGVAYNASIGGVRMLDGSVNDAVEAKALSLQPQHIDIYSASWGPEDDGSTVDGPGPLARRAFIYGVTSGRQGKGSIFVWASGNGGRYTDSCNCDGYTNSIFTLSISSATQGGFKPWYLEECSSTLATTYSSGTPGHDKSVATVDMDGRLRPDHICTVEHTGTSASAPLAAGIAALALEANPSLTWRDMQYLVVMTSRPEPLEKESGWILNGVKRKFSHKFGYGLMDAGAMVSLAEQWTTVPPQHICKSRENNEDRQIEGSYGFTLSTHMDVNGCAGTINEVRYLEHVQCKITLRFFPRGNLRILLTSPMGTTSTLLFERPRDIVKSNFDDWPFLSVHFWGEKAEGRWTLQIINGGRRRVNQPGILSKWQLIFYGTSTNPVRLKGDGSAESIPSFRRHQGVNPFVYPTDSDLHQPYNTDPYSGYLNYQNLFTGSASNPEKAIATVDGHNIPTPQRQTVMADSNNKLVLHDCDPECDSQGCYGRGPTQCVACKHYRLDNTCVSRCPPRSFPNQGGVCWPCHESCETCAGAGQDSCLTCAPAHLHVTDLAVCLQVCPDGYYENTENKTCVPCESNCASCQDRPNYCMSCDHHLVMHEHKCYSACPVHTFETEDYNCASCHPTCETCNGSSETQCITCRSGRFSFDGKCLNKCPDGYYGDKKRQECMECPKGCSTCISNGICLTCQDNWNITKKGKCIANREGKCDDSEYYGNGNCHPCHSTCESCDAPTERNCLTCPPSLLLQSNRCVSTCDDGFYMESGVCTKCLHTCIQCVSRMNCTACAKGLQLQSGECRTTCADGYYSDRGTCAKCYLSCNTCSGPRRDQCVTCPDGWQLAGGECHPECPEGFYKSEFGCQKCHHYCKTCNGAGPLACTSCPLHFMLDGGLCMECLGSQYYDPPTQTCKTCHESCRTCSGPGQYSCQNCAFPLHLDRLNNQCVPCCASDASPDDQSCCHCDKDTGECINASPAGKRRIAAGAEQQFLSTGGLDGSGGGGIFSDSNLNGDGNNFLSRFGSPFTAITAIAVAACLLIVTIFALIFAVLQRNSHSNNGYFRNNMDGLSPVYMGVRYNKLTGKSKKLHTIINHNDDDDDDDDDNDENDYDCDDNSVNVDEYSDGDIDADVDEKGYLLQETDNFISIKSDARGAIPKSKRAKASGAKKFKLKLNAGEILPETFNKEIDIHNNIDSNSSITIPPLINSQEKVNAFPKNEYSKIVKTTKQKSRELYHYAHNNDDSDSIQFYNDDGIVGKDDGNNIDRKKKISQKYFKTDIDNDNSAFNDESAFNRNNDTYQERHHQISSNNFHNNEMMMTKAPNALSSAKFNGKNYQNFHQFEQQHIKYSNIDNNDNDINDKCDIINNKITNYNSSLSETPSLVAAAIDSTTAAAAASIPGTSKQNLMHYENSTIGGKNTTLIDELEPIIKINSTMGSLASLSGNNEKIVAGMKNNSNGGNTRNTSGHNRTKSVLGNDLNLKI